MIQVIKCTCCARVFAACKEPNCYTDRDWLKIIRKWVLKGDKVEMVEKESLSFSACVCKKVEAPKTALSLRLPLKTEWFEMTNPDDKTEDYRELTPYWYAILCLYDGQKKSKKFWEFAPLGLKYFETSKITFKPFDFNIMTLGYPSNSETEKIKKFKHKGIEIRTGKPEWGAKPDKLYFVILHGEACV